jgi:hypothetical protein
MYSWCSAHGETTAARRILVGNLKERDHFEDRKERTDTIKRKICTRLNWPIKCFCCRNSEPSLCLTTGEITNSMQRSPSWKANSHSASQERARWIQSTLLHPISLRSILILSSHLHLGLPSGFFLSGFPTKVCMHFWCPWCVLHAIKNSNKNNYKLYSLYTWCWEMRNCRVCNYPSWCTLLFIL